MTRSQQSLLRDYGIRPVKRRGQNFLVDTNLARAIAQDSLELGNNVLELGAGGGALTVHLLESPGNVVCVEIDRNLCALLSAEYGELPNFKLVEADLAKLDWVGTLRLAGDKPVVAGNLPYVLTSKVLFALADHRDIVSGAVFMVQKEVAERMVATCGGRDFGILAVVLGSIFDIRISRTVPSSVFWPKPDVESAIVQLVPSGSWSDEEFRQFVAVVKALFQQRRKKLRTQLRSHFKLTQDEMSALSDNANIDLDLRPEQLDALSWRRMAGMLPRKELP